MNLRINIPVYKFIDESNRIEGISRPPTCEEQAEFERFMAIDHPYIEDLETFLETYQPDAVIRDKIGLDVRVGNHIAPKGGPMVRESLRRFLNTLHRRSPFTNHVKFEVLHPFTDGNGRAGRMLWAWQVRNLQLGFLHMFYYQTLANMGRGGKR